MPCMRLNVLLSAFEAKFEALKGRAEPIGSRHGRPGVYKRSRGYLKSQY